MGTSVSPCLAGADGTSSYASSAYSGGGPGSGGGGSGGGGGRGLHPSTFQLSLSRF
jgi:hypothetical protein